MDTPELRARALTHAKDARRQLDAAAESLGSAGRWALFDLLGGGWFAASAKHRRMDKVRSQLRRASRALAKLNEITQELGAGTTGLGAGLQLSNSKWERTIDTWVDDPFTDWRMHSRIRRLRKAVDEARTGLDGFLRELARG